MTTNLYRWQHQALDAWYRCGRRGVIEAVTGSGKTDVALTAIEHAVERGLFALVIVPSRVLMEQWHERLTAWLPEAAIGRLGDGYRDRPLDCDVLVTTRHSAASQVPLPPTDLGGLLVADECHGFGGGVLRKSLLPEYQERLGLTATLERSDDAVESVLLPYFGGICYRYEFADAIADGVCAQPRVAFLAVPLSDSERQTYDETEASIVNARQRLKQIDGIPHHPFGDFLAAVHHLAANDAGPDGRAANDYLDAFSTRREIVATSSAKYAALGHFAQPIQEANGTLLFTETVPAANHAIVRLDPQVRIELITGETPRRDRSRILDGLRDGNLDAVAAPRVLDEGVDVPNANLGLVVSASRTRRQMIQRMGRVLRRKPVGEGACFVIIFASDTMEDPRLSDDRDGFLEEIEQIAEKSGVFAANQLDHLSEFLSYTGPAVVPDPVTLGPFLAPNPLPPQDTAATDHLPYLEMVSPELPEIKKPRQTRRPPRLSSGENPVTLTATDGGWALSCTGCGVTGETRAYKWQALEDTVACQCIR